MTRLPILRLSLLTAAAATILAARKIANAPPNPKVAARANATAHSGPWTHEYITVNNLRFHYAAIGRHDAPLVILLHGFPECWYEWARIMPRLAAEGDFRVVAPDMRGYNLTDKPDGIDNYTLDKLASDIDGLIHALGYTSAYLVAHDWGGGVAWQTATEYPQSIDKLVIINAPHPDRYSELIKSGSPQLLRSYYIFLFQLPILAEAMARLTVRNSLKSSSIVPGAFSDDALDVYENAIVQPGAITAMLNYYRAGVRHQPTSYSRDRQITCPTLLIWGMKDFALVPELSEGLTRWVPNLEVQQIDDSGHWVPEERPTLVTNSLLQFLK
jgi:pimeloyl-ACP methyl ester carboxylesterase